MNILYLCSEYPPFAPQGGIGTVTKCLAESLVLKGHNIYITGLYNSTPKKIIKTESGVTCILLKPWGGKRDLIDRIRLYRAVRKIIREHQIDLIEAPDFTGITALWPKLPIPVILRLHGSSTFLLTEQSHVPSRYFKFFETRALKQADVLIGVSNYILKRTREIFTIASKSNYVIYNGVKTTESIQHLNNDTNSVVFSGTLMRLKGVFSLIKAWNIVHIKIPEAHLHIYGKNSFDSNGSVLEQLQAMLADNAKDTVTFHGHVDQKVLCESLLKAKLAVFPSYTESLGMAPLEAMAAGCPTIFTKAASGPEVISDMVDGILIDPDQPAEIADKILFCFQNRKKAKRLGENGYKKVVEKFNLNDIITQNETMYRQIIKNRQHS